MRNTTSARKAVREARARRNVIEQMREEAAAHFAETLREARKSGLSVAHIAEEAGLSRQAVYDVIGAPPATDAEMKGGDVSYWLVCVGTNEDPFVPGRDDWRKRRREWAEVVGPDINTFSRRPRMSVGDILITYGVGSARGFGEGKIFAVDEVTSAPEQGDHPRWSWEVGTKLLGGKNSLWDAPGLSDIDVEPRSVRRQSYIRLTPEQGEKARRLILGD